MAEEFEIPGAKGKWTIKIEKDEEISDKIWITYTPHQDPNGCKEIRLIQTQTTRAYDGDGKFVTSDPRKIYLKWRNPLWHHGDDYFVDATGVHTSVDHGACSGDPFYNGHDDPHEDDSAGDATIPTPTTMYDKPVAFPDHWKAGIKKVIMSFETCAVCEKTGEVLGCVEWSVTSTADDFGDLKKPTREETSSSDAFKGALKKFCLTHIKKKGSNGPEHWYCPEVGEKGSENEPVEGPIEGTSPFGAKVEDGFKNTWSETESESKPAQEEQSVPPGKPLKSENPEFGFAPWDEQGDAVFAAAIANPSTAALKWSWAGSQSPVKRSIVLTPFTKIESDHIRPFLAKDRAGQNDRDNLLAYFVTSKLITTILNVAGAERKVGSGSKNDVVFTVISAIGSERARGYQGDLTPEQFSRLLHKIAVHDDMTVQLRKVFQYLNLNFWSGRKSRFLLILTIFVGGLLVILFNLWLFGYV